MGFIAKLKSMVLAKKCPVLIFHSEKEVEWKTGIVIEENTLRDNWNNTGWEKRGGPILFRKDGKVEVGYAVVPAGMSCDLVKVPGKMEVKGSTVDLTEDIVIHPWKFDRNGNCTDEIDTTKEIKLKFEGAIGKATSADIIEKGLDLSGSNKKLLMGILVGILAGTFLLAPMLRQAFG